MQALHTNAHHGEVGKADKEKNQGVSSPAGSSPVLLSETESFFFPYSFTGEDDGEESEGRRADFTSHVSATI
jgi:hypothetical protein